MKEGNDTIVKQQLRIPELDIIKGIAIIAVIFVHLPIEGRIRIPGITFHLSSFFTVTGVILYKKRNCNIKVELKKRFQSIIIPYIILSVIYMLLWGTIRFFTRRDEFISLILKDLYLTVSGLGIGTLWFLPTLFFSCLVFQVAIQRKYGRVALLISFVPVCVFTYLCTKNGIVGFVHAENFLSFFYNELCLICQILIAVCMMAIGTMLWELAERIKKINAPLLFCIAILSYAINVMMCSFYNGNDMHYAKIINPLAFIICIPLSTFSIIVLAIFISHIRWLKMFFEYMGINSLIIMTTHYEYSIVKVVPMIVTSVFNSILLCKVVTLPLVCMVEILICLLVNKLKLNKLIWRCK